MTLSLSILDPHFTLSYLHYTHWLQVIAAKGEQKASGALRAAAETMELAPAALQLRFLQVWNTGRQLKIA